ncbi:MAG: phosphoheptose isomerase, partial [Fibrobacterota bacterium]
FVISTSGDSMNLVYAARTAKAKGLKVAGLLGRGGGKLKDFCDVSVIVPGEVTHTVQELHLPVYHYLCAEVEKRV